MTRKSAVLVGFLAALGLYPGESLAQLRKHTWEGNLFWGQAAYGSELELDNGGDLGLRAGFNFNEWLGVELSYDQSSSAVERSGSTLFAPGLDALPPGETFDMDVTTYKADLVFNGASGLRRWRGYGVVGLGKIDFENGEDFGITLAPGNTQSTIFDVGGGVRYYVTDLLSLRGDLRVEYALGDSFTNLKPTAGVSVHFGGQPPRDIDEDGVSDVKDRCADTPYGAIVDLYGCPGDSDGDKALDGLDKCPETPAGWPTDESGCPTDGDGDGVPDGGDGCAQTPAGAVVDPGGCPVDSDADGIFDGLDRCEGTPAGAVVDETGCPVDSDRDAVFDGLDRCPDTPRGVVVDGGGCPVDSDADGIFDGLDQCPGSAPGTNVDETGCPRIRPAVGEKLILEGVQFDRASANLAEESYPILEAVLLTMQYYPEWTFEIQGHTDSDGTVEGNQILSEGRARSVRAWFIERGVAPARLTAKGFGEATPLTDNLTDIGKSRNRRVELLRTE
ncbi:MAG: OmpA family protein [Acidobacteria bacterium]|nr:OmpA family protein [Acidobacteriota bacterium]